MKRGLWLLASVFVLLIVAACAPEAAPTGVPVSPAPQAAAPQVPSVPAPAKAAWEEQWASLGEAAKKEGTLVLYTTAGGSGVRGNLTRPLKDKFGLRFENISGRGSELAAKLSAERRAGLYLVDVYIGGGTTLVTQVKAAGMLDPLEPQLFLPEVLDPKVWHGGELPWVDKGHYILGSMALANTPFAINTNMVKPEELKSYRDLLNPKWKGKIILNDPTAAGLGGKFFTVVGGMIMGYDYMRELAKQEPIILRDQRLVVEWVARGKYPISITAQQAQFDEFRKAGAPIAYVMPVEGCWKSGGQGNIGLINRATHPNAAKLFINWVLTREGQTFLSQALQQPSVRLDVPTEGLEPSTLLQPGVKYYPGDSEEVLLNVPEQNKLAQEIFGHLMK